MGQLAQFVPLKPTKLLTFWLPLAFVSIVGGLVVLALFITLTFQIVYLNRVYPGVSVMGIEAGGMTEVALITAINERSPQYLDRTITVMADNKVWQFTGQELGVHINASVIANEVYSVGREGDFFDDMLTHFNLLRTPYEVAPLLWYDTGPTNQAIKQLAEAINRPPKDAQLIIHSDAQVEVIPAERGRQLHLEATRAEVEAALFGNKGSQITAVVQEVIPAIPDVSLAQQQAEDLLQEPLVLRVEATTLTTTEWQLAPTVVAELINIVEIIDDEGKSQITLELDAARFTPYLQEIAQEIYRDPVNAQLDYNEISNQLLIVQESQDGYALDEAGVYAQLPTLIEDGSQVLDLPLVVTAPAISSADPAALGIQELISESTSYFQGSSEGRMHNINLAATQFQNVVIPPGELFSFNEHLGDVSTEAGYDESLIIFGNRTTVGIGGGVCQVSTTVFRAAFFGGFEIVERWAHGYRVGWYETNSAPGLDATIYTPSVDFKFRNDTGYHILIKTETDLNLGTVTFRFYGTKPDREVIVSEPQETNLVKPDPPLYEKDPTLPKGTVKQVDWANDGLDVTVTRVVKEGDVILYEDEIVSRYKPWQAVYKVGTGES